MEDGLLSKDYAWMNDFWKESGAKIKVNFWEGNFEKKAVSDVVKSCFKILVKGEWLMKSEWASGIWALCDMKLYSLQFSEKKRQISSYSESLALYLERKWNETKFELCWNIVKILFCKCLKFCIRGSEIFSRNWTKFYFSKNLHKIVVMGEICSE